MPQFTLPNSPIQDLAVRAALDQEVITPLQSLMGGVWGLGVWRNYLLSSLLWSVSDIGAVLTIPSNLGTLGITRVGDNTMLFTLFCPNAFTVATSNTTQVLVQMPDGITYACRQPVDMTLNRFAGVFPCIMTDSVSGNVAGYVKPSAAFLALGLQTGSFIAGRSYNVFAQWAMEIAVAQYRA